jgi:hypothetical protein
MRAKLGFLLTSTLVVSASVVGGAAAGYAAQGGSGPGGAHACDSANTNAVVFWVPGAGYQTGVMVTDWSDPNNPSPKQSTAVTISATPIKNGVKIAWTPSSGVNQKGGAIETSNAVGYSGKYVSATQRSATISVKGGTQFDFADVCFEDPHFPAPPAPQGPPGSVGPATARRHASWRS